jgi:hypothetical protein
MRKLDYASFSPGFSPVMSAPERKANFAEGGKDFASKVSLRVTALPPSVRRRLAAP